MYDPYSSSHIWWSFLCRFTYNDLSARFNGPQGRNTNDFMCILTPNLQLILGVKVSVREKICCSAADFYQFGLTLSKKLSIPSKLKIKIGCQHSHVYDSDVFGPTNHTMEISGGGGGGGGHYSPI